MSTWLMKIGTGAPVTAKPRLRIIAIPHAGGWPSSFRSWRTVLPNDVELWAAQLPGRGLRIHEQPVRRVEPMAEGLSAAIAGLDPLPYAIVGHSFGSVLGYELTKVMERRGLPPGLLVVSARQPPCFPSLPPFGYLRTDTELMDHLIDIGGVAPELISRSDLMQPAMAAIRADLEAMETYQRPMSGTEVPVLSLGAVDDPIVIAERLHLWSLETSSTFSRQMFTGGHFYLYDPEIATAVTQNIIAYLDDLAGWGIDEVVPAGQHSLAWSPLAR